MEEECLNWLKNELNLSQKVCEKLKDPCGFTCISEFLALNDELLLKVANEKYCDMNFG